ncbi:MAG: pyridoxamine 5'-phosphate oxidase family protein [Myxococcales bacterium]|nr:pyridoxamine 5'-phosphate oxidase family protein [Myxococcales bacterium]
MNEEFTPPTNDEEPAVSQEAESEQNITKEAALIRAEHLLRTARYGVLSTVSQKRDGWPFGSILPYAISKDGDLIIYTATIAEHTRNFKADSRVSLLVHQEAVAGDIQAHGRLTVMGEVEAVPPSDTETIWSRYIARLPEASGYSNTHGFNLYRIRPMHLRYIGGFGEIFWLEPQAYREHVASDPLTDMKDQIVNHMNSDHQDALRLYCKAFKKMTVDQARMTSVDAWGFDVMTQGPDNHFRFDFVQRADHNSIRPILVDWVKRARAQEGLPT